MPFKYLLTPIVFFMALPQANSDCKDVVEAWVKGRMALQNANMAFQQGVERKYTGSIEIDGKNVDTDINVQLEKWNLAVIKAARSVGETSKEYQEIRAYVYGEYREHNPDRSIRWPDDQQIKSAISSASAKNAICYKVRGGAMKELVMAKVIYKELQDNPTTKVPFQTPGAPEPSGTPAEGAAVAAARGARR